MEPGIKRCHISLGDQSPKPLEEIVPGCQPGVLLEKLLKGEGLLGLELIRRT
jgi:hypothetical protein